jgi:hypothetical protein
MFVGIYLGFIWILIEIVLFEFTLLESKLGGIPI